MSLINLLCTRNINISSLSAIKTSSLFMRPLLRGGGLTLHPPRWYSSSQADIEFAAVNKTNVFARSYHQVHYRNIPSQPLPKRLSNLPASMASTTPSWFKSAAESFVPNMASNISAST